MLRRTPVFSIALCLAVVATACGGDDDDDGAQPTTSAAGVTTTAADEPVRGGTLVVAISSDPGGLNPAITTSGATHTASELMFNGLVALDENLEPQPELAESWEISDDGATYTFTLRDDVVWHDGEAFTSEDVKFTFEEMLLEFHGRTRASVGANLDTIETPDDHTVVFRFTGPYAPLLQQLNVTEAPILPAHVFEGAEDLQNHPANNEPVGTGPFQFVSYDQGTEIRTERNPNYFKDGLPYLDAVVQRVIADDATQILGLENGEIDWVWGVPGPDISRLRSDPEIGLLNTSSNPGGANCIMTMSFNLDNPIFDDVRTRRAVFHALDRDQFLEQILFGSGEVAEAPISSGIPFAHEPVDLPDYDVDEAESLLDEVGWTSEGGGTRTASGVEGVPDGTELAFDFLHFPTFSQYGELVRQQLGEVGIEVTQRPLEPSAFGPTVFGQDDFDTNIISYCNATDPEIGVRRMYDSAQIGSAPFTNSSHYSNPQVDELFQQAAQEVDTQERSEIYAEIQEILAEDLPYIWVVETLATRAHSADCSGFKPYTGLFAEAAFCRT